MYNAHVYRPIQCTLAVCHDCIFSFSSWNKSKDAEVRSCMGHRRTFKCSLEMYWRRSLISLSENKVMASVTKLHDIGRRSMFKDSSYRRQIIPILCTPVFHKTKFPFLWWEYKTIYFLSVRLFVWISTTGGNILKCLNLHKIGKNMGLFFKHLYVSF